MEICGFSGGTESAPTIPSGGTESAPTIPSSGTQSAPTISSGGTQSARTIPSYFYALLYTKSLPQFAAPEPCQIQQRQIAIFVTKSKY